MVSQPEWLDLAIKFVGAFATLIVSIYTIWKWRNSRRYRYLSFVLSSHVYVYGKRKGLEKDVLKYARSSRDFLVIIYFLFAVLSWLLLFYDKSPSDFFGYTAVLFAVGMAIFLLKRFDISLANPCRGEADIKKRLRGTGVLMGLFIISYTIVLALSFLLHEDELNRWYIGSALVAGVVTVVGAFLFSGVLYNATYTLWKVRVSANQNFADDLPHLIVKTKTGNIFFGRLYDPLDDKALILRKAKLVVHGGREVCDTLEKVISHAVPPQNQENYISIPWDDIETLQIVEDGLYKPPKTDGGNKNEDSTEEKDARAKPESASVREDKQPKEDSE